MTQMQTDYDLHGIVGVRLLDASEADAAIVDRQLGPIRATLARQPDLVIRFVDRLPLSSPLRYLGVDDAGFTDDAFLILRSKHKAQAKVQIPVERLGGPCEIVCERGLPAVPLLIAIVNLTALGKGILPLHASACTYNHMGIVFTGWAKGGKTEALLAFMAHGAGYVGDEWIYLCSDGRMYGIPEPIRVWDWHLAELPRYWAQVRGGDRLKLRALKLPVEGLERLAASRLLGQAKMLRRVLPLLKRQQYVHLPPRRTFGESACPLTGRLDRLFFVMSHATADLTVRPMDAREIARRMVFSLQEERAELLACYYKFRFAFPRKSNELIEQAEALQLELLRQLLAGKEAYAVHHPYPVAIPALFQAISPYCGSTGGAVRAFPVPAAEAAKLTFGG
jgi:hypothetical protein